MQQQTILNKINCSNLLVSGASTLLSSLNAAGNVTGSRKTLTNLNYNAIMNPSSTANFNNPSILISTLNVSETTTLNNAATCRANIIN